MAYRPHGHEPNDGEIARLGYKAFGPRRPPLVPTKEQFARAGEDMATGEPEELADTAAEVAGWWPGPIPFWPWGYDDD